MVFPLPPFAEVRLYAFMIWVGVRGPGPNAATGRAWKSGFAVQLFSGLAAFAVDSIVGKLITTISIAKIIKVLALLLWCLNNRLVHS